MSVYATEMVALDSLRPHPQNYRKHPEDQLAQIKQSIAEHGVYKNIVVARDGTILAGHGAVIACRQLGMTEIPVKRIDCDPFSTQAMKIIIGDNEIGKLGETDDRALTEMLKTLNDEQALLGTGFDDKMLAGLLFVTRAQSEVQDMDAAAHWVGLPGYEDGVVPPRLVVSFRSDEDRDKFMTLIGAEFVMKKYGKTWTIWWPEKRWQDLNSLKFAEPEPKLEFDEGQSK